MWIAYNALPALAYPHYTVSCSVIVVDCAQHDELLLTGSTDSGFHEETAKSIQKRTETILYQQFSSSLSTSVVQQKHSLQCHRFPTRRKCFAVIFR
uniref:Uncharacterized protein n=1 Tax=Parascaris univalens TaxID=6257 RepID=A0A915BYV9_PARUN